MPVSTHTPASAHLLYLMSLTDKDISIWRDPNQVTVGLYRGNPDATREVYTWDLRALGQRGVFTRLRKTDPLWYKMWLKEYDSDSGSSVYKSLPTIFTVSPFNYLDATGHVFSGSFSFYPLIADTEKNGNQNAETYNAERAIWQAALFPAMPMLFASTINKTDMFGPVFLKKISFSVSGESGLSPVNVSVEFSGGKTIKSPVMDVAAPEVVTYLETTDYQGYRSASMIDCLSAVGVFTDLQELKDNLAPYNELEKEQPTTRILDMKLNISQEIEFSFTGHKGSSKDSKGPRFAEIKNRVVNGSFTYFSREDAIILGNSETNPDSGQLTMYFGGPYLFPMSNVDWQKPIIRHIPGQGYYHVYNFIARAADNAIQMGFKASDLPSSEFEMPSVVLDNSEEEEEDSET